MKSPKNVLKNIWRALAATALSVGVLFCAGCPDDNGFEDAGESMDEAVEEAGESLDEAGEKIGESLDEAGDDIEKGIDEND